MYDAYQPHNILVTGGAGFIGCNYIRFMLKHDKHCQIINLDALTYAGSMDNIKDIVDPNRYQFINGNIGDSELVASLLLDYNVDTIVHFAAESHVDRSISNPKAFIDTNVVGTYTLLHTATDIWLKRKNLEAHQCRFHHISTDEVYGSLKLTDPAFTEQSIYAPNSPYSASKAGSDHLVRAYHHTFGLPVTTSNCSNNYGPYQHTEKFIPTIINACLRQTMIPVYGDGTNIRDWLYVEDHCRGIDKVIRYGKLGECYNIGGDNEQKNIHIVNTICHLMDELYPNNKPHEKLLEFVTDRPGHDWRYAIDCSKIKAELNWQAQTGFIDGLTKTIQYYCE